METDVRQCRDPAESLAKSLDLQQHESHQNNGFALSAAMVC